MSKYKISYETSTGEIKQIWCKADTIDEAERVALNEYWDIDRILIIAKTQ